MIWKSEPEEFDWLEDTLGLQNAYEGRKSMRTNDENAGEDFDLLEAIKSGSESQANEALSRLMKKYNRYIDVVLRNKNVPNDSFDDAVQLTWMSVYGNVGQCDIDKMRSLHRSIRPWLARIAKNVVLQMHRKNGSRKSAPMPVGFDVEDPKSQYGENIFELLKDAIKSGAFGMTELEYQILHRKFVHKQSRKEMARDFDIAPERVDVIVRRAKKHAAEILSESPP